MQSVACTALLTAPVTRNTFLFLRRSEEHGGRALVFQWRVFSNNSFGCRHGALFGKQHGRQREGGIAICCVHGGLHWLDGRPHTCP